MPSAECHATNSWTFFSPPPSLRRVIRSEHNNTTFAFNNLPQVKITEFSSMGKIGNISNVSFTIALFSGFVFALCWHEMAAVESTSFESLLLIIQQSPGHTKNTEQSENISCFIFSWTCKAAHLNLEKSVKAISSVEANCDGEEGKIKFISISWLETFSAADRFAAGSTSQFTVKRRAEWRVKN